MHLSETEREILELLGRANGLTAIEIALALRRSYSHVRFVLKRLEANGYVKGRRLKLMEESGQVYWGKLYSLNINNLGTNKRGRRK